jgi:acetyltransferase-like isoleucine patch superfamily enzyme
VLSPYAAVLGAARIDAGVFMGSRSTVLPGLHVGEGAKIAAGAIVTTHVPAAALAAGNPATARVVSRVWSHTEASR